MEDIKNSNTTNFLVTCYKYAEICGHKYKFPETYKLETIFITL